MSEDVRQALGRPSLAFGCIIVLAGVVVFVGVFAFAILFLESGANAGNVRLDDQDAYAPGSVEYVGNANLFLVRLRDGSFVALSDLDAPNRATSARRCRVALVGLNDPGLGASAETLQRQMSASAAGASAILREACNGAVYDIAGARLEGDGPNLDRYPVTIARSGRIEIDTSARSCSRRTPPADFSSVPC